VLGGGRYDGLIEALGGPPTPAVGWAAGIERLAMLVADAGAVVEAKADVVIVAEHPDFEIEAIKLATLYRRSQIAAEVVTTGSPKKRFDRARKLEPAAIVSLDLRDGVATRSLKLLIDNHPRRNDIQVAYDSYLTGCP
jgi:histidyl-tRNA synthetase